MTSGRRLARLAPFLVGLLIILGAVLVLVDPAPVCRGERMEPGSTCAKTDGTEFQTYDQRIDASRFGGTVMLGTGVAVLAFGAVLTVVDRRRTA